MAEPLILHVIDELKVGGAQTHLVTMLREDARAGRYRHRVVSLFGTGPIHSQVEQLGIPVDVLDVRPLFARRRFDLAARTLANLCHQHRPDIVEAHLTWSRLLSLPAAWRAGVPRRIAFEHGDLYLNTPKFRTAHFVGQRFAYRIIVVSQALAEWARHSYRLSNRRAVILHNPVDLDRFRQGAVRPATDLGLSDSMTKLVAVGTLGSGVNKRVDVLIRAAAVAREAGANVALVVCGDGALRPELEGLAMSLGVADRVRFLGMRQDVPAVLAACDVFVHGAEFEPFGIVAVEALAMGLPIVVPDAGGMVEAVEPGKTGLVYPVLDHRALAAHMIRLDHHPVEREQMSRAARRSAVTRFSVTAYMDHLYAIYGTLSDERSGGEA